MELEEKIKNILEHYIDACAMCTNFDECNKCDIPDFIYALKEAINE